MSELRPTCISYTLCIHIKHTRIFYFIKKDMFSISFLVEPFDLCFVFPHLIGTRIHKNMSHYNQIMAQTKRKNGKYHVPLLVLREEHWRKLDNTGEDLLSSTGGQATGPAHGTLWAYGESVASCSDVYVTCPNFETLVQNILKDSIAKIPLLEMPGLLLYMLGLAFKQYTSM